MNINHILSGQSVSVRPGSRIDPTIYDSPEPNQAKSTPLVADRFTLNEPWKNKATVTEENGTNCRCGSCSVCGAKSYADQQKTADEQSGKSGGQIGEESNKEVVAVTGEKGPTGEPLKPEELAHLQELQKIDQKVRAHEQAHMNAAGGLAISGVSLSYTKGPDGQSYAVGGEVSIDTSKAATPQETLAKMMKVRGAALAPTDPSPQDRKVAAAASVMMGEARAELQLETQDNGEQVVEQAGQRIVDNADENSQEDESPAVVTGGSYQRGQYQKVAKNGGEVMPTM